jgi:hypothetical protein
MTMKRSAKESSLIWLLAAVVLLALLTGFGNMPLYGRYYIADIPGFHWSGNFLANLKVHLAAGALLLALALYRLIGFVRLGGRLKELTGLQKLTGAAMALVLLSGVLAGLKNFAFLKPGLVVNMTINFFHMGTALLLAAAGLAALVAGRKKRAG